MATDSRWETALGTSHRECEGWPAGKYIQGTFIHLSADLNNYGQTDLWSHFSPSLTESPKALRLWETAGCPQHHFSSRGLMLSRFWKHKDWSPCADSVVGLLFLLINALRRFSLDTLKMTVFLEVIHRFNVISVKSNFNNVLCNTRKKQF